MKTHAHVRLFTSVMLMFAAGVAAAGVISLVTGISFQGLWPMPGTVFSIGAGFILRIIKLYNEE